MIHCTPIIYVFTLFRINYPIKKTNLISRLILADGTNNLFGGSNNVDLKKYG